MFKFIMRILDAMTVIISFGSLLKWYSTLEYGEFHEKFNFLTIQDLRPLNTCQKHFEMILPNFPLDECEI